MHTLYHFKPAFQNRLRPLVNQLAAWHVSPNQVTLSAMALSGAMGLAIACLPQALGVLLALPIVLLGRMGLNAIDGMLAREHGRATSLGCLLNELGDVFSDAALYLPFGLLPGVSAPWVVGVVMLAMLAEMAGVLGLAIAHQRAYQGPMGKSDRAFVFGAVGLMLGLGVSPGTWLTALWAVLIGLQLWTLRNRVQATLEEVTLCS
ncbi:MAG: CDP-alcohol phosphatidyltransferase family protein [Cyanobacteria bacterium Co-bin13]|nr:CDP-alcohol phosphatidyltransferase family protein [Cyanobacteria bacterium Co-bin13]